MKVSHLRRLRQLAYTMRNAAKPDAVEWCARAIAGVIAEIDTAAASPEKIPPDRDRIGNATPTGSAVGAALTRQDAHSNRDRGAKHRARPIMPETDRRVTVSNVTVPETVSRETVARRRPPIVRHLADKHPLFEDDPVAVAESEREHRTFSLRYGWRR
jgi:hypothetical protein